MLGKSSQLRRDFLGTAAVALTAPLAMMGAVRERSADQTTPVGAATSNGLIRPYRINVPESALLDLRQRLATTRWPDRETVSDQAQGVQLATMQDLVQYWKTDYNWRTVEAQLELVAELRYGNRRTRHTFHSRSVERAERDAADYHARLAGVSRGASQGYWASDRSRRLRRPPEDAFDVVLPSLPGYGFSGKPAGTGWNLVKISQAWHRLMLRLGYTKFVSQGGDWGALVSEVMAAQQLPGLVGIHVNMPGTVPANVAKSLKDGDPAPDGLSDAEKRAYASLNDFYTKGSGYYSIMGTRPQTLGYGLADSPVALAAWFYDKFAAWTYSGGQPERVAHQRRDAERYNALLAHEYGDELFAELLGSLRR